MPALPRKPWPLLGRSATRVCAGAKQHVRRWYGDLPTCSVYEPVMLPARNLPGTPLSTAHRGCPTGCPWQDSSLRSRLRRPPTPSREFVRSTCLYSVAAAPRGQDHSACILDHVGGAFRPSDFRIRCSGCPAQAGCARVHGCPRLRQGADDCGRCRHGCCRRYQRTSRLARGESSQGWALFSVSPCRTRFCVVVRQVGWPIDLLSSGPRSAPHGLLPRGEDQ